MLTTTQILQFVLVGFEASACIVGVIKWNKIKNTYWKWLVVYLGVIVISEIAGLSITYLLEKAKLANEFYTFFVIPIEFLFFIWLYYQHFKTSPVRYWPLAGALIYLVTWVIHLAVFPDLSFWNMPLPYLVGVIVLFILGLLFFFRFIYSDEILKFKSDMMFWVSLGLLLFFLISSPFFALRLNLYQDHRQIFWIYHYAQFAVNYVMYTCFIIAFIWGKPR